MKNWLKQIIILYLIIVLLKISLAYFISAPSAFSDNYGFLKEARSLFYYGNTMVHGIASTRPPLYSVILSISYVFKDMNFVYFFMKVINALVSSLIIFPAWLISREFFNKKKAMLLTIMVAVFPAHFSFTFFLMAENLFYPLFMFSIYFIYKSFVEESYKWDILAGIFIGLSYLTKIHALILPLAVILVFLFKLFKKDWKEVGKKIIMAFSFFVVISPLLIRNGLIFGWNKYLLLGAYGQHLERTIDTVSGSMAPFLLLFFFWFIFYLGYLMMASGFIFFVANFLTFKNYNNEKAFIFSLLTFFSVVLLLFLAARHNKLGTSDYQTIFANLMGRGRIIGRYVEAVIPLILINGLLGVKYLQKKSKIYIIPLIILVFSSQLIFFQLFPINNMSLTWLGVLKFIFDSLLYKKIIFKSVFSHLSSIVFFVFLVVLFFSIIYLQRKTQIRKLLYIFIIFFSLVSLLNFMVIYYNSYTYWYTSEQIQLGMWFNKYDPQISTVLFDERDGCKIYKTNQTCIYNPFSIGSSATVIGFWMNDDIKIGSVVNLENVDYVVSRHKLDLPLLKETNSGIFLYKTNMKAQ